MTLSKDIFTGLDNYLNHFFKVTNSRGRLSPELADKVRQCEKDIETGNIDELQFELLLNQLIVTLNEHMFVWKRLAQTRASDFMHRGPQFLYIMTAPDLKTCIADLIALKECFLPPSYTVQIIEDEDLVLYQVFHGDFESPLPHIKDDTVIALSHFIFKEVAGNEFDYLELWFPEERVFLDPEIIAKVSNAKVLKHKGPMTAIISKKDYDRQNPFYNKEIRASIAKSLELKLSDTIQRHSFTDQVATILSQTDKPASLTMEKVAAMLNKSVSTFRRNLAEENTSFKELQGKILDQVTIEILLNSEVKIDSIAVQLGYAERSTFERAFRKKFGTTPANLRAYRNKIVMDNKTMDLQSIVDSLPPIPESCRKIITEASKLDFDIKKVVSIVEKDPIFSGRIMGLANKSIYGKSPQDLSEAIGRNLGLSTIKNLAIVYAAKDSLQSKIKELDVDRFIQAQIIAPHIFRAYTRQILGRDYTGEAVTQILMFGMLGFLVLCHNQFSQHQDVIDCFKNSSGLNELTEQLKQTHEISIFKASVLLLTMWGLSSDIIKFLSQLEDKITSNKSLRQTEEIILITFSSCLSIAFDLDYQDSLKSHAKRIRGMDFDNCWQAALDVKGQF